MLMTYLYIENDKLFVNEYVCIAFPRVHDAYVRTSICTHVVPLFDPYKYHCSHGLISDTEYPVTVIDFDRSTSNQLPVTPFVAVAVPVYAPVDEL